MKHIDETPTWSNINTYIHTPFSRVLVVLVCLFLPNYAPFVRYGGYEISGWLDRWRHLGFIIIEFESLEVTYPPFSSVLELVVCLVLLKSEWFGRYRKFKVLGLHGRLNWIALFILGFWGDLPPIFKCFDFDGVFTFP
jgi:hypothetical protein